MESSKFKISTFFTSLRGKILFTTVLITVAVLTFIFLLINRNQEKLLFEQVLLQTRTLFRQIQITRRWVADHGGVYVEKLPWVKENPYLKNPSIVDITGKKYVKENPAYVTRQLSEYSKKEGLYWFKITSLKLINPLNRPDEFEKQALIEFESQKIKEKYSVVTQNGQKIFRYLAPLYAEKPCLKCHGEYKIGDIRGAISISLPVNHLLEELQWQRLTFLLLAACAVCLLILALYFSLKKTVVNPIENLVKVMDSTTKGTITNLHEPSTDELKKLYASFGKMMKTIASYENHLEEKIRQATEDLLQTNRKLNETMRKYRELSERKSDFIAYLSHEMRTPLTSIKGAVDFITAKIQQVADSCSQKCDLMEIKTFSQLLKKNVERLTRLVNMTLDLEKIESGQVEFTFRPVDFSNCVNELCSEITPSVEKKSITLKKHVTENVIIPADEDRICEVICNLLENAVEHTPPGGEITVELVVENGTAELRISDTGPGIPPEKHQLIFKRFYHESKTGSGLGLAIARAIVLAHGGEIGVISDGKSGSTFYVRLPYRLENVSQYPHS